MLSCYVRDELRETLMLTQHKCDSITETVQDGVRPLIESPSSSFNSDDLDWPSRWFTYCKLSQMSFRTAVQQLTRWKLR